MFRTVSLSIIRSFSLYTQQWYISYRIADSLLAGSGCSILILLESCLQTCMIYTIAVCIVKNSWWWTEELYETCRVSFQNKFEKLVHLVGFIISIYSIVLFVTQACLEIILKWITLNTPNKRGTQSHCTELPHWFLIYTRITYN